MADPSRTQTIGEDASLAVEYRIPQIADAYYTSMPILARLLAKGQVVEGTEIWQPIIHDKKNSGTFTLEGTFNIGRKKTKTALIFDWAYYYANSTIDRDDQAKLMGSNAVVDWVEEDMDECEMSLKDDLATGFYSLGTDPDGIVGARAIADDGTNVTTYGGITRDTTTQGTAAKGSLDATGGVTSFDIFQTSYGAITFGGTEPDLGTTTQPMYNKLWARTQTAQRFVSSDLAKVGFRSGIQFNNMDLVVDNHCPAASAFLWTTDFLKLCVHSSYDMVFTGYKPAQNTINLAGQILWYGQLVAIPRHFRQIQSLT